MLEALLVLLALVGFGVAARAVAPSWRRELLFKRLGESVDVDLGGLATAALPPTFHEVGIVNSGERQWFGGDLTSLEYHLDERRITFRLEQGQHNNFGGYKVDPVLLDVTLFNENVPAAEIGRLTATTIDRFYPVPDDEARNAAHFAAQRWLPDAVDERATVTRAAATNEGRGDNLVSGPPERWLVIHADSARRVRVDLYAWRKAYSLDEARALVRSVAAGVRATPALQRHFDDIETFDARMAERHTQAVTAAETMLAACGVSRLVPGEVVAGDRCLAHLSANRRDLRVARLLGSVPLAARTDAAPPDGAPRGKPEFPPAEGLGDQGIAMVYWDAAAGRWEVEKLRGHLQFEDRQGEALFAALAPRDGDRSRVRLVRLDRWDLQFHPDRLDVDRFLAESARVEAELRAGTVLRGVPVTP